MFTHLVLMNKSPFYIYCQNQKDALENAEKLGDHLIGIVETDGESLIVKQPRKALTFEQEEIKEIECDEDMLEESKFLNSQKELDKELGLKNELLQQEIKEETGKLPF